jgi:hypothetical protein
MIFLKNGVETNVIRCMKKNSKNQIYFSKLVNFTNIVETKEIIFWIHIHKVDF